MMLPTFFRQWLWEKEMRRSIKSLKPTVVDNNFAPKRCVLLYPADMPAWAHLVQQQKVLWPATDLDFAFIGYSEVETSETAVQPPYHLFTKKQLGPAYNLPGAWLQSWSHSADILLVANPTALPAIDLLAAQFPAFFRASVYATEFGELYSFVLQSGPDAPDSRLEAMFPYLQKIMKL